MLRARVETGSRRRSPSTATEWPFANDMDGVPDVTQPGNKPGGEFMYEFTAPDAGTYIYHPHTGTQLDRGLYAPLIVEDPASGSERNLTLLLDDWIDAMGETPDDVFARLRSGMGPMEEASGDDVGSMGGMESPVLGTTAATEPGGPPRRRHRRRGLPGLPDQRASPHRSRHVLGQARGAAAAHQGAQALAVFRAGTGPMPMHDVQPAELQGKLLTLQDLRATPAVAHPAASPDRTCSVALTGIWPPTGGASMSRRRER